MYIVTFDGFSKKDFSIQASEKKARLLLLDWLKRERKHFPYNDPKYSIYKLGKKII